MYVKDHVVEEVEEKLGDKEDDNEWNNISNFSRINEDNAEGGLRRLVVKERDFIGAQRHSGMERREHSGSDENFMTFDESVMDWVKEPYEFRYNPVEGGRKQRPMRSGGRTNDRKFGKRNQHY